MKSTTLPRIPAQPAAEPENHRAQPPDQWRRLTSQPVEERAPFKALDDVTFSDEQSKVLGIIGLNDANKSQTLKFLAKTSKSMSDTIKLTMTPHA